MPRNQGKNQAEPTPAAPSRRPPSSIRETALPGERWKLAFEPPPPPSPPPLDLRKSHTHHDEIVQETVVAVRVLVAVGLGGSDRTAGRDEIPQRKLLPYQDIFVHLSDTVVQQTLLQHESFLEQYPTDGRMGGDGRFARILTCWIGNAAQRMRNGRVSWNPHDRVHAVKASTCVLEKLVALLVVDGAHDAPQHPGNESVAWTEDAPIHQYQLATAKECAEQGENQCFRQVYPTTSKVQGLSTSSYTTTQREQNQEARKHKNTSDSLWWVSPTPTLTKTLPVLALLV